MRYLTVLLMTGFFATNGAMAQESILIYPGAIPGAKPTPADFKELSVTGNDGIIRVSKVSVPTLKVFLPSKEKATGAAVIICPGGGYGILAINHEGDNVAKRFNEIGVAAFVLKYRLPDDAIMVDKSFGPLQDAEQAIYLLRKDAAKYHLDPAKIGIMGFSAGGHLAATLTVHYKDVKIENKEGLSLRPDFSMLIYPVVSFLESPHTGSAKNLAGPNATDAQKDYFSNERHVDAETPVTFLVHANDDKSVPVENSLSFNRAMVKAGNKAELHVYQGGGHGFGLNNKTSQDQWFDRLVNWMKSNKII
ncbi:alpha/beta hydrolase [Pedobacter sp. PLR]|uniref:alpha/beta hydrolase n=1 Tax=Pedobacter sp. PLR TaxID=2994465 RepID=UPI0022453C0B|nr:alpha/beta hydrolase [Pedobacter sp. PLR]MCX2450538.1 alpha/beta hydrolase [Pedobacter sp. PLR]